MTINNNFVVGMDGQNKVAYTRNIFNHKYISAVALANVGTNISFSLSVIGFQPANLFIEVTPGLQLLVDWSVINIAGASITPLSANGDLVTSNAGFTIPATATHLNFYPIGAPATGNGYVVFSFSS